MQPIENVLDRRPPRHIPNKHELRALEFVFVISQAKESRLYDLFVGGHGQKINA